MTQRRFTPLVTRLPATVPFVGPETQERTKGTPFIARLGANESVFGPSPRAVQAIAQTGADAWMYGDPENYDLRAALATHHDIPMDTIVVGEGIDGLLGYFVRMMVSAGDAVVTSDGAYPTFNYHVAGFGGVLHTVPYSNDHEDPAALIAKARAVNAKLIYLANPDNPMGSWHTADVIAALIADIPDGCTLVLDEAYIDTAPEGTAPPIDTNARNVIRFRTFSKAYGLAGMRVGYAIADAELIAGFNRIRNHFGMSRVSQAAALAALQDQAHLATTLDQIATARARISAIATENGLTPLPSATNFVTVDCGGDGDLARKLVAELSQRGIFIRMPFRAPQDRCIRISCAPEAELAQLARSLPQALAAARG